MGDHTKEPLEDAEFYVLEFDQDSEATIRICDLLDSQYDPDPATTQEIARARFALQQTLDPNRGSPTDIGYRSLFEQRQFALPANLVPIYSAFRDPVPQVVQPFFGILDRCVLNNHPLSYEIASENWRAAIESIEPHVHEFFVHKLQFSDGVLKNYFIFRCRQHQQYVLDYDHSDSLWRHRSDESVPPKKTVAYRAALSGKHWVTQPRPSVQFVSRALASRLRPLLLPGDQLIPVQLTDDVPHYSYKR
jgi:hypothetical protein